MYWCKECNRPLADPLITTEYEIHREVDDRRYERFEIPYCPACGHEVYEAKQCSCGKWTNCLDDWCADCLRIRDKAVIHCIAQIRLNSKLKLSSEETRDLILNYFGDVI